MGGTGGCSDQDVHRIEVYFDLARIATSYRFNVFSSFSLFESLYFVIAVSDSNDHKRTMVLQVILVVNMFSSLVPRTWLIKYSRLEYP